MADRASVSREALKYLAKGQIDKAIAEWEKLAKTSPDANTFNTIGDLYLKKGDTQNAVVNFHNAARIFRNEGFSLKGLAIYKKILNIKSSDADALYALGELNEEKDITTDAIKYYLASADVLAKENKKDRLPRVYQKITGLAPSNIPLRTKVAELFSKEGFAIEAAKEFVGIATLYDEEDKSDKAVEFFKRALEIQPRYKDPMLGLSAISEKTGDMEAAVGYLKTAVEKTGEDPALAIKIASLLLRKNSLEEAAAYASRASELDPSNIDAKKLLGDIYQTAGELQKAWDIYTTLLDEIIYNERFDEAIDILNKFKDIEPVETRRKLISLYNQTGDSGSAFEELKSLAGHHHESGRIQEALGCYKEASNMRPEDEEIAAYIKEIEKTLGIEPERKEKTLEEVITEADIFIRYGLFSEAKGLLESTKVRVPENIEVHLKLKSLYLDTHDPEQAVSECIVLAELYGRAGDAEKRQAIIEEAYKIAPEDPRLLEKFEKTGAPMAEEAETGLSLEDFSEDISEADFYFREGLIKEASEIYKKLIRQLPENEELKERLSTIEKSQEEELAPPPMTEELEETETLSIEEFAPEAAPVEAQEMSAEPALESDVLDIFEEFKRGLEKELEEEDSETHYNLGIAYKEMGLIDDAIKAFQTTKHDPKYFIQASSMLGICYMQKGLYPLAIDAFTSALMKVGAKEEAHWGLKFDLAEAYHKNGNIKQAFDFYTEVYGWNSAFRDVAEKINALRAALPKGKAEEPPQKNKKSRVSYI